MHRTRYIVSVLLFLVYGTKGLPRVDPLVDTDIGLIRGLEATDGEYSMFLGIPYATVDPANPFGPSIPHQGFDRAFNAYDDNALCPQREEFHNTLAGTLDCLHLNVYVPHTATTRNPRPVMVWIHGGGFSIGFGGRYSHGPKFLVRHDVIVVTINYRLGAYGWMCLNTPEVPGNQGLKDQLTALRWVKNNIEAFGGDSNQITIMGESAGAAAVDYHLIYSQENLFNNVIIQSGTALASFANTESDPSVPIRLAERLGHNASSLSDALDFLRTVDTDTIVETTSQIGAYLGPCVEQEFANVDRYVTGPPTQINIPNASSKAILIGFNSNEFGFNFAAANPQAIRDPFPDLPNDFDINTEYIEELVDIVRKFYLGEEDLNEHVQQQLSNFRSDISFFHPTYRSIRKYFENGASSIYHYMFSYDGNRNFLKRKNNITADGALHADEIGYLFDMAMMDETPNVEDQLTIDRITTLWTNFVKYRDPTPEITEILPIEWPAVTTQVTNCLVIDSELSVQGRPFHERMAFWDVFFKLVEAMS